MWKVVVWLSVLAAAEAFKEPYIEYLYSRKDGQALIKPISSPGHGSYARNKTIYITNTNPDLLQNESMQYLRQLSQTREPRFLRWTSSSAQLRPVHDQFGRFRGQEKLQGMKRLQAQQRHQAQQKLNGQLKLNGQKKPSYSKLQFKNKITNTVELSSNKMKLSGKNAKTDPQLELLKQLLKPEEVKTCTEGASIFRGCNHCLCIGGQLYVCTARVCKPGDMNLLIAFEMDTNCIEGERIHSFDVCNRCYCGGGHILCTKKKCRGDGDGKRPQECTPGTEIPSPDSCNICACNTKGFVVCTTKTCGPEISPDVKDMGCKPDSLERHSRCKECYCLNGKKAFCYVNLCKSRAKMALSYKSKTPQLDLPGALPDHCDVDDYMQDRCTKCFCTHVGIWYCKTREIGKCDPKLNPFAISNHDNNGKETTTTQLPATDDSEHTTSKKRRKRKKTTTTTQLPATDDSEHTTSKQRRKRKKTTTTTQLPTTTTTDPTTSKTKRRRKKTTTTTQLPHEYYDYSDEYYDYSDELNVTKGPFDAFPDDYDSHETISSDIDSGPFCTKGQYFTQGSDTHCQGCFCTMNNEWKFYSIKGSCREFPKTKSCNTGKLRKSVNPCSICYCGNDHKSYCATDETCSYSIKPNSCEPISCMNHCMGEGTSFGVCHNDGCICVN